MTASTEYLSNGVPRPTPSPTTQLENRRRALELARDWMSRQTYSTAPGGGDDELFVLAGRLAAFLNGELDSTTPTIPDAVLAEMKRMRNEVHEDQLRSAQAALADIARLIRWLPWKDTAAAQPEFEQVAAAVAAAALLALGVTCG